MSTRHAGRRYVARSLTGMAVYTICFVIVLSMPRQDAPLSYVLALLSVLGIGVAAWALYHYCVEADEYLLLKTLQALALSVAMTVVCCFAYGMFEAVAGAPHLSLLMVPAVWGAAFGLGAGVVRLRA